jgi:prepilin-type processing-associated H-X9-DG protein
MPAFKFDALEALDVVFWEPEAPTEGGGPGKGWWNCGAAEAGINIPTGRHGASTNVACGDGHVELMSTTAFKAEAGLFEATPSLSNRFYWDPRFPDGTGTYAGGPPGCISNFAY